MAGSSNNLLPSSANATSMFGNFATSTNKSIGPPASGTAAAAASCAGLGLTSGSVACAAAQYQHHVSFMNKYQQRLIDTLNPILDGSSTLGCKDLERGKRKDFLLYLGSLINNVNENKNEINK